MISPAIDLLQGSPHSIGAAAERRLAACVNVIPRVESIYRWQGKVESAQEWLLVIKTTAQQFSAVRNAIQQYTLDKAAGPQSLDDLRAAAAFVGDLAERGRIDAATDRTRCVRLQLDRKGPPAQSGRAVFPGDLPAHLPIYLA